MTQGSYGVLVYVGACFAIVAYSPAHCLCIEYMGVEQELTKARTSSISN